MNKIFIDTSAWIAYSLVKDQAHQQILDLIKPNLSSGNIVYTSNYIVDETITRLVYDTNWSITTKFIQFIDKSVNSRFLNRLWVDEQVEKDAMEFLKKYSDHKLSFTDVTTAVLVKHFGINTIITLDSDFTKIGLSTLP